MGLLRSLAFGLVFPGAAVLLSEHLDYLLPGGCDGLRGEVLGIGTHVGDVTVFVKPLGDGHRLRYRHTELASRLLLECGCGERPGRVAFGRFAFAAEYPEVGLPARPEESFSLFGRIEPPVEFRLEKGFGRVVRAVEPGSDPIVGGASEIHYLALALDDEAHCDALDSSGRERRFDLLPEYRREFESDQPVEYTPCLLCIDEVHVDGARILDGGHDGALGNFVENDAPRLVYRQAEHLCQVPGDGFPFAVFIGCEPNPFGLLRTLGERFDEFLLVGRYLVIGFEVVVYGDAELLFREVADVTVARHDGVVLAEEFFDGFRLCRRLDDDEVFVCLLRVSIALFLLRHNFLRLCEFD